MDNKRAIDLITPVIIFFILLFVYTKLFGPIQISVNSVVTQNPNIFQTTGTGEAEGIPNKASASLGVTQEASSVDEARSKANRVINKVVEDLKKLGINEKDIKTTNFSVYPNPEPVILEQGTSAIAPRPPEGRGGFTASANIEVKTDSVDLANRAIDTASAAGANVIGGVSFTFDDSTTKKLEMEARNKAVKEAKEKARELADAAGIRLGKVINIQESGGGFPIPYGAELKQDTSQTDLQPGENKVSITVTLTFETL